MSFYKYFSDAESLGLSKDLMYKLERMREFLNLPIRLTETVATGGSHVADTAHATGEAVDGTIRAKADLRPFTLDEQLTIAWAAGRAGFDRCGVYDRHFHVDVSKSLPRPAIWTGVSH